MDTEKIYRDELRKQQIANAQMNVTESVAETVNCAQAFGREMSEPELVAHSLRKRIAQATDGAERAKKVLRIIEERPEVLDVLYVLRSGLI